tara:strand:- start:518 stop:733 length:216 start_codon:yes stop_codon:yes gene_type:complete
MQAVSKGLLGQGCWQGLLGKVRWQEILGQGCWQELLGQGCWQGLLGQFVCNLFAVCLQSGPGCLWHKVKRI